jgi:hypothetical protein
MSDDAMRLLRAHDPERGGAVAPPIERLLERLEGEPGSARPTPPPRTHRRPVAVAVALACIAAVAVVAVAVGGGGGHVTAPAPAGNTPGGAVIVHTISRTTFDNAKRGRPRGPTMQGRGRSIGTLDGPIERWSAPAQRRWRQLITLLPGRAMRGGTMEQAGAGRAVRTRRSWDGKVERIHGGGAVNAFIMAAPGGSPDALGYELATGVPDPAATVRAMVARGEARANGETTREGRRLLRFFGETPREQGEGNSFRPASRTTYLVDADSYAPVEIVTAVDLAQPGSRFAGRFNQSSTTVFERYENLPLNSSTARLLRFGGPTR